MTNYGIRCRLPSYLLHFTLCNVDLFYMYCFALSNCLHSVQHCFQLPLHCNVHGTSRLPTWSAQRHCTWIALWYSDASFALLVDVNCISFVLYLYSASDNKVESNQSNQTELFARLCKTWRTWINQSMYYYLKHSLTMETVPEHLWIITSIHW